MKTGVFAIFLLLLSGCGYRAVSADDVYRGDIQSIAVPVVQATFHDPQLVETVTAALVKEIEARTPYRVRDAAYADTLLQVTIDSSRLRGLSRNRSTGLPEQQARQLSATFTWSDLRNGGELLYVENFEQSARQYPTLGEGRFIGTQQAAEAIAAGIVDELQRRW